LFIFFASDNVLSWMSHPFLFYPIMMIAGGVAVIYSMGMGGVVFPLVRQSINLGFRQAGLNFQI
jgi:hypothetical protein